MPPRIKAAHAIERRNRMTKILAAAAAALALAGCSSMSWPTTTASYGDTHAMGAPGGMAWQAPGIPMNAGGP
jgi:hypothetical protein